MREIECRKGFTLVEVMIVLTIIGIFVALMLPLFLDKAHGFELQKPLAADDATISKVAKVLRYDKDQTVTVMIYIAVWTHDNVDVHMANSKKVKAKLIKAGISTHRISYLFANEGGPRDRPVESPPVVDGVYLILD